MKHSCAKYLKEYRSASEFEEKKILAAVRRLKNSRKALIEKKARERLAASAARRQPFARAAVVGDVGRYVSLVRPPSKIRARPGRAPE